MKYREKRGHLSQARRTDAAVARLAGVVCAAMGIKKQGGGTMTMWDFLPYEEHKPIDNDLSTVFKMLGGKR